MKLPQVKMPAIAMPDFKKLGGGFSLGPLKDGFKQLRSGNVREVWSTVYRRQKMLLLVEINEPWLKFVVIEDTGKEKKWIALSARTIANQTDLDIGLEIDRFLALKTLKPTSVIISHPAHNLTNRILTLPSADPKEIKDIVQLQAVKQTPYSREEIVSGFHIIESDESGYSRVLVAIAHRDTPGRYFRILEFGKLNADLLTLSLEGSRHWFDLCRQQGLLPAEEGVLCLDLDSTTADLFIYDKSKLVFSRSFPIGHKQLAEQAMTMEFVQEVQRSMESGRGELKDSRISQIILTGVEAQAKDIAALLSRELNLACSILPPGAPFQNALPAPDGESVPPVSFVSLLGLAVMPADNLISLMPAEVLIRKELESRAKDLALLGTLCLVLIMMISMIFFEKLYKKSSSLSGLEKQYQVIARDADEVERMVAKMKLVQEISTRSSFLDALYEINEVIPRNITLTGMQFNHKDKAVAIKGVSEEMSAVFQFLSTLEATPEFEQVKTRNVTKKKVDNKDMAEFEMTATISQGQLSNEAPAAQAPAPAPEEVKP